jgi:transposase-like protein
MSITPMKKQARRRHYSEDFKREAVATYEASGKSRSEICRLLDISCGSLLQNWSMLYSGQKRTRKSTIIMTKSPKISATSSDENTQETTRIASLEAEVKRLKQTLGNHAVKDYLAELREESWREISSESALKEVDKRVSKKL